jgi:hypothetical protein
MIVSTLALAAAAEIVLVLYITMKEIFKKTKILAYEQY